MSFNKTKKKFIYRIIAIKKKKKLSDLLLTFDASLIFVFPLIFQVFFQIRIKLFLTNYLKGLHLFKVHFRIFKISTLIAKLLLQVIIAKSLFRPFNLVGQLLYHSCSVSVHIKLDNECRKKRRLS